MPRSRMLYQYAVTSVMEGDRKTYFVHARNSRGARQEAAKKIREELGIWETNLRDIRPMLSAKKIRAVGPEEQLPMDLEPMPSYDEPIGRDVEWEEL